MHIFIPFLFYVEIDVKASRLTISCMLKPKIKRNCYTISIKCTVFLWHLKWNWYCYMAFRWYVINLKHMLQPNKIEQNRTKQYTQREPFFFFFLMENYNLLTFCPSNSKSFWLKDIQLNFILLTGANQKEQQPNKI